MQKINLENVAALVKTGNPSDAIAATSSDAIAATPSDAIAATPSDAPANLPVPADPSITEPPLSERAVALIQVGAHEVVLPSGVRFHVKKQVTRTVLHQVDGVAYAVAFTSEIRDSEVVESGRGGKAKMSPARISEITNLESGELQILIMNTVLEGELTKAYPDNGFVGKMFTFMRKQGPDRKDDRGYKVYQIAEIEFEGDEFSGQIVSDGSNPVNRSGVAPGKRGK